MVTPANLRRLREQAGLSQEELAERIGASAKSVRRWEGGKGGSRPSD